jgi:hypothetical protein
VLTHQVSSALRGKSVLPSSSSVLLSLSLCTSLPVKSNDNIVPWALHPTVHPNRPEMRYLGRDSSPNGCPGRSDGFLS